MASTVRGPAAPEQTHVVAAAAVIIIVTILLLFWSNRRRTLQGNRLPPGPKGWPVLGSLPALGTLPHRNLRDLAKKYGPIMFMHLGSVPTLVVSTVDLAKEVLRTNDQLMASRPYHIVPSYLAYDQKGVAFSPYGPGWRQARKICTLHLLTAARVSEFQSTKNHEIKVLIRDLLKESRKGNVLHMDKYLSDTGMNIITQMMWSKRYRGVNRELPSAAHVKDFSKITQDFVGLIATFNFADYLPVPATFKSSVMGLQNLEKKMKDVRGQLEAFLDDVIKEHQENELRNEEQSPSRPEDFVDVLLKLAKSGEYEDLSPESMKAILQEMLSGGTDTTSLSMEWALAEIVKHPAVQKKLQDELNSVVGPDRLVSPDDIPNLKYLQAVVKESLRLHLPAPLLLPHKSMQDCNVNGYHIPANTSVLINAFAIHRDPAIYERPEEFNPDRFLHSAKDIDFKGSNLELIPFGSGRRMCPAANDASATMHLSLAHLLHVFTWTFPENKKPKELAMMETMGIGVRMLNPLEVLAKPRLRDDVLYPISSMEG